MIRSANKSIWFSSELSRDKINDGKAADEICHALHKIKMGRILVVVFPVILILKLDYEGMGGTILCVWEQRA